MPPVGCAPRHETVISWRPRRFCVWLTCSVTWRVSTSLVLAVDQVHAGDRLGLARSRRRRTVAGRRRRRRHCDHGRRRSVRARRPGRARGASSACPAVARHPKRDQREATRTAATSSNCREHCEQVGVVLRAIAGFLGRDDHRRVRSPAEPWSLPADDLAGLRVDMRAARRARLRPRTCSDRCRRAGRSGAGRVARPVRAAAARLLAAVAARGRVAVAGLPVARTRAVRNRARPVRSHAVSARAGAGLVARRRHRRDLREVVRGRMPLTNVGLLQVVTLRSVRSTPESAAFSFCS